MVEIGRDGCCGLGLGNSSDPVVVEVVLRTGDAPEAVFLVAVREDQLIGENGAALEERLRDMDQMDLA